MEARAFAELVTYIESAIEEHNYFFKFSELQSLYEKRLQDFGILKEINTVCFKKQILSHFPEAQAQSDGENIVLIFEKGMEQILQQAYNCNYKDDALVLSKAAKIIQEDIKNSKHFHFTGTFPPNCLEDSIPTNLKYFISMLLLNGSSIKNQDFVESQSSLTICQTILFNCKRKSPNSATSHYKKSEPLLPLYIGLKVSYTNSV